MKALRGRCFWEVLGSLSSQEVLPGFGIQTSEEAWLGWCSQELPANTSLLCPLDSHSLLGPMLELPNVHPACDAEK